MTLLEAAALSTFGARDRRVLRKILRVLTERSPSDDDAPLPERDSEESFVNWMCRCRTPHASSAQICAAAAAALDEGAEYVRRAASHAIVPLHLDDGRYPPLLRAIPDPPVVLWTRGAAAHLTRPSVAIVGSRAATAHGLAMARRLAGDLAAAGLVIVSGLARGVDSAAHAAALDAGGATIAVLGCGVDRVYPPEHSGLARNIVDAGVVVSEFPPDCPPLPHHFPLRNRVISGLAHAVVVIEAPERSGSLITAAAACEQGRDVLVVPGPVVGGRNRGGHLLIRDGAKLVESADDVLHEIGRPVGQSPQATETELGDLPKAVDFTVDDVAAQTGHSPSVVLARLLELELAGRIQRIGGGRFVRSAKCVLP
jgi:DNA processing protein